MTQAKRCQRVRPEYASEMIDILGGTAAVSRICGIRDPSVSSWRKLGMPKSRFMFLSERYKKLIRAKYENRQDLYV